ncbi:MAG TPA: hypothetical protein GXX29_02090 [Firmicutes bacterium]|nr:hypothetical protein [Bacillota bacterium]
MGSDIDIEQEITNWKQALKEQAGLSADDLQELEDHLRDQMDELERGGLAKREALLIAMLRLGQPQNLIAELSKVHSDRLWKQLFAPSHTTAQAAGHSRRELVQVILAAVLAALLGKIPLLFGISLSDPTGGGEEFYFRNLSLFVAPVLLCGFYFWRRFSTPLVAWLAGMLLITALTANLYPFQPGSNTSGLVALHMPLLLWLVIGVAYCGDDWRSTRAVWDFTRYSGEFFIYSVLIAAGGMVFMALATAFAEALGIQAENFLMEWVGFSGLLGVPIVAAYLAEKKRSLIANMAPMLAKIFIPLFLLLMVALILTITVLGQDLMQDRNTLILIDILLMLVVGMVLYDLSARDEAAPFGPADTLNLALMLAAIIIDCYALAGIAGRLGLYGFSPNKTAALGENILLLANLAGLAVGYIKYALRQGSLQHLLSIQTRFWPFYLVWLAFVVWIMPLLYNFR